MFQRAVDNEPCLAFKDVNVVIAAVTTKSAASHVLDIDFGVAIFGVAVFVFGCTGGYTAMPIVAYHLIRPFEKRSKTISK
jgi:hypothetical protein